MPAKPTFSGTSFPENICGYENKILGQEEKFNQRREPETLDEFVSSLAKYRHVKSIDPEKQAAMYAALGLVGEAGEYSEKIKKWHRDGVLDRKAAALELGDVLYYLVASAFHLGFTFAEIEEMMREKLTDRQKRGKIHGSGDNR